MATHYMVNANVDTECNFCSLLPKPSWFIVHGEMAALTHEFSLTMP